MVERFSGSMSALDESESGWLVRYSDYATLKAENERLERELADWKSNAEFVKRELVAERALAERAGGVKVKALAELERALCEFTNAASDQYDPSAWIPETKRNFETLCAAYNDAYSAGVFSAPLTTEPAAPEERAVTEAARSLVDRLDEFDLTDDADEMCRQFVGRVEPVHERLRAALKAAMEAGR